MIINKNILHIYIIKFILNVFDTDSDHMTKLKTHHIIEQYNYDIEIKELTIA